MPQRVQRAPALVVRRGITQAVGYESVVELVHGDGCDDSKGDQNGKP
jgi:hypothetical protein